MVSDNDPTVWHVKLPAEWKAIFDELAEKEGDTTHGAATRQFRRLVKPIVEQTAEASA